MDNWRAQTALQALERGLRYSSDTRSVSSMGETPTRRLDLSEDGVSLNSAATTVTAPGCQARSASTGGVTRYNYNTLISPPPGPAPQPPRSGRDPTPFEIGVTHRRVPSPSFVQDIKIPSAKLGPTPMFNSLIRDLRAPTRKTISPRRAVQPPSRGVSPSLPVTPVKKGPVSSPPVKRTGSESQSPVRPPVSSPSVSPPRDSSRSRGVSPVLNPDISNNAAVKEGKRNDPYVAEVSSAGLAERCLDVLSNRDSDEKTGVVFTFEKTHLLHADTDKLPKYIVPFASLQPCLNVLIYCLADRGRGVMVLAPYTRALHHGLSLRNDVFVTTVNSSKEIVCTPSIGDLEKVWGDNHAVVVVQSPGLGEEVSRDELKEMVFWAVSRGLHLVMIGGDDRAYGVLGELPSSVLNRVHIVRETNGLGVLFTYNESLQKATGYLSHIFHAPPPITPPPPPPTPSIHHTAALSAHLTQSCIPHFFTSDTMWLNLTSSIKTPSQEQAHHKHLQSRDIHTVPGLSLHLKTPGWFLLKDYEGVPLDDLTSYINPKK